MRGAGIILTLACAAAVLLAQEKADEGPTNQKAQKTGSLAEFVGPFWFG